MLGMNGVLNCLIVMRHSSLMNAALEIMEKPNKTKDDFALFIKERGNLVQQHIAQKWEFIPDAQQVEDEEEI